MRDCLCHPFFWTFEEKLDYIVHVSDALLRHDSPDSVEQGHCKAVLNSDKDFVFPMPTVPTGQEQDSPWNWRSLPEDEAWQNFVDRVQKSQHICSKGTSQYDLKSFLDFLKMIRNVNAHMNYNREDVSFGREIRLYTMENTKEGLASFV